MKAIEKTKWQFRLYIVLNYHPVRKKEDLFTKAYEKMERER